MPSSTKLVQAGNVPSDSQSGHVHTQEQVPTPHDGAHDKNVGGCTRHLSSAGGSCSSHPSQTSNNPGGSCDKDEDACTTLGCDHYRRKVRIKANCCQKYFGCRLCHDEEQDHNIERKDTKEVACLVCGAQDMPVGERCLNCNTRFAHYYCDICKFYDDDRTKDIYHCDDCGICRLGKREEQYHCKKCDSCVPESVKDSHPCLQDSLKRNCPVCQEYMANSTEQVVYMRCGHAIHASCFTEYTRTSYTCPLCWKALTDMKPWYDALDASLAKEFPLPWEYGRKRSEILCNDCEVRSTVRYHFRYHKCSVCSGYNTRVLSVIDGEDCKPSEPGVDNPVFHGCAQSVEMTMDANKPDSSENCSGCCDDGPSADALELPRESEADRIGPVVNLMRNCGAFALGGDADIEPEIADERQDCIMDPMLDSEEERQFVT